MRIKNCSFAGRQLEELEETLVRPQRPLPVLLPAHSGERAEGHHPARGGEGATVAQQERQGLGL